MLKVSKPRQLAEGVTMSPARLMLEILAIYETFGCLTTGQEPTLISDKWESWWFEGGRSSYEEHSVEKQFGSMSLLPLVTRFNCIQWNGGLTSGEQCRESWSTCFPA